MRILIFGDSIAYGYHDVRGGWAERLRLDPEILSNDHSVYPLGVSGDTTEDVLNRFEAEIQARYDEEKPFIIIAIGTNDSHYFNTLKRYKFKEEKFQNNYKNLLSLSNIHGGGTLILGLPPVEESKVNPMPWAPDKSYHEVRIKSFDQIIKKLAANQSIPLIDLMKLFNENGAASLLDDGVHPNSKGHELIYNEVKKILLPLLKNHV